MAEVLYRKYRAKSFAEIIGQQEIVDTLRESIKQNRVSHSYLFTGARGTGKTSIARILAKAINCTNFDKFGDACNECANCIAISNMETTDVVEMDAASNRGVDEIRDMKSTVDFVPSMLKKKIYIIDEAHMLTKEAFNALLKTLEEPPEHIVFIFATTEPHKLPVTILSRVQRYDFGLGSREEVKSKLSLICKNEGMEINDDVLDVIYKKSGGSYRDAESLLGKVLVMNKNNSVTKESVYKILGLISDEDIERLLESIKKKDLSTTLEMVENISQNGGDLNFLIDQLLDKLRESLLENIDDKQGLNKLMQITGQLIIAKKEMKEFPNKKTVFEITLIRLCENGQLQPSGKKPPTDGSSGNQPANHTSSQPSMSSPKDSEENVQNPLEASNVSDVKSILVSKAATISPRIKAILSTSVLIVEENIAKIKNASKFNLTLLNKPENVKFFLETLREIDQTIENIEFVLESLENKEVYQQSQRIDQIVEDQANTSGIIEEVDNTELVANLL